MFPTKRIKDIKWLNAKMSLIKLALFKINWRHTCPCLKTDLIMFFVLVFLLNPLLSSFVLFRCVLNNVISVAPGVLLLTELRRYRKWGTSCELRQWIFNNILQKQCKQVYTIFCDHFRITVMCSENNWNLFFTPCKPRLPKLN